jgi:hypothetical protein
MSCRARSVLFFILTSFAAVNAAGAQQPSTDTPAGAQSEPPKAQSQPKQESTAPTAASSDQSTATGPQPAASSAHSLATVVVNGGPSADILRSARNAGFKVKIANGTTRFCRTEAPVGTRFASESCISEEQFSLLLHRAQDQRDQLTHMLGAPANSH